MIKFFRPKQNKVDNEVFNDIHTYIHTVLKALVVNLLLLCLLFLFVESVLGFYLVRVDICSDFLNNQNNGDDETKNFSFRNIVKNIKEVAHYKYFEQDFKNYIPNGEFRKPSVGAHYNGDDIILAGCSFTYGCNLNYKDTFGAVLTKFFPKYKVYNIGLNGASPRETLYILRNCEKYQNQNVLPSIKDDDVKFFIYTAIADHKARLFLNHRIRIPTPLYKVQKTKNGEKYLKFYESANPLYRTFTYSFFANKYMPQKIFDGYMHSSFALNLFTLYMQEIKKEVDKIYPNAKFILFIYYDYFFQKNEFDVKAIENLGVNVVELNEISKIDFSEQEYRMYDRHPNGRAWREIVPLLGKELNL